MILDLTDAAVCDLRSISAHTREIWGNEQEEKYLAEMWAQFERIQKAPEDWRFREDLFPGCRIAARGKHVILFRIKGEVLQIVRVLHSAMDFKRHVPKDL